VLDSIDQALVGFLEEVSLLERFSAEMCDFIAERSDSAAMIQ
jgi:ATP/maltotriose-dependent transcriptional regulator MalT